MNRQALLWTLVAFFGASLVFNALNDATEGEDTLVRIGVQVLALALILAFVVWVVRRRG